MLCFNGYVYIFSSKFAYVDRLVDIIEKHDGKSPLFLFYSAQNPHSDDKFNVFD